MNNIEIGIEIDTSAVDAATESFDRLKVAIEAVNAELTKLGDKNHGGISIQAVGSIVHCEVKPKEDILHSERAIIEIVNKQTRSAIAAYVSEQERRG